jgi:glycosyltransferase involved in cell wall biosynthesis
MNNELVTVIIPSYNRFKYLIKAIESIINQTYKNIEIIIVNDCSTQEEYYSFDFKKQFGNNIFIVNSPRNSRSYLGKIAGGGNARNIGIMLSKGEYIAFLDDDDYFLPTKIEKQINAMKKTSCLMSCTEGYRGMGMYQKDKYYQNWHYKGHYWGSLQNKFKHNKSLLDNMYKNDINIWNKEAIYTHNCILCSSAVIHKSLINKAGYFPLSHYGEDWLYWKKIIKYTNCVFLREPLTYMDSHHGEGRLY